MKIFSAFSLRVREPAHYVLFGKFHLSVVNTGNLCRFHYKQCSQSRSYRSVLSYIFRNDPDYDIHAQSLSTSYPFGCRSRSRSRLIHNHHQYYSTCTKAISFLPSTRLLCYMKTLTPRKGSENKINQMCPNYVSSVLIEPCSLTIFLSPVGLRHLSTLSTLHLRNNFFTNKLCGTKNSGTNLLASHVILYTDRHCYSKDYKNSNDEQETEDVNDVSKDLHSDKDKIKLDPDLKAVLEEIKSDFHDDSADKNSLSSSDSSSDSDSSSSDEVPTNAESKPNALKSTKAVEEEDFIYDYRYADDIEDFGFDEHEEVEEEERPEKIVPIPLTRGREGVFELDELLKFLDHLGVENTVTVDVPPEANYCDHMVVCSAKSQRHLQHINDEFLWIHKRKKSTRDPHLHIEGLNRSDWCAMDMGNIVLHVFYGDARQYYDIESLWTLGPENDPKCQGQADDPLALSEEDLFWLEASKMKGKDSGNHPHLASPGPAADEDIPATDEDIQATGEDVRLAGSKLDEEAGWNHPKF